MPRKKTFEREEAVEIAKNVFWRRGYQNLGVRGIEEETGLGRFAINTEFGGKEGLLVAALESYLADGDKYILNPIREGYDLDAVTKVIEGLSRSEGDSYLPYGCLILNTAIENSSLKRKKICTLTNKYYSDFRRTLHIYFSKLRREGVVDEGLSVKEMVEFVVGVTIAVNFMNRNAGDVKSSRSFADASIKTIRAWGKSNSSR